VSCPHREPLASGFCPDCETQVFICGRRNCDAGGTEEDGGHVFDIPYEIEDEYGGESGARCRCGMSNVAWAMWNGP
jgi:hypothetical protein